MKVFALDGLRVLFPNDVLLRGEIPLVRPPSISVKARDTERLKQLFELQKDPILPPSTDVRQYGPTAVIDGMPRHRGSAFFPT